MVPVHSLGGSWACGPVRRLLVPVAVAAVLAAAGCSAGGSTPVPSATNSPAARSPVGSQSSASTSPVAAVSGSSGAGITIPTPGPTLTSQRVAIPGTKASHVVVGLESLRIDGGGKTLVLRLQYTPDVADVDLTAGPRLTSPFNVYELEGRNPLGTTPFLVDRRNLKRYDVLYSNGHTWSTDIFNVGVPTGGALEAYYVFAAPQDAIDTIDVHPTEFWPPFQNVPVQR
jgi:hypothetical protein